MIMVFTAFSGYDSQCLALERLKRKNPGFDYELVGWSEIDKHAIKAHNAIFPQYADRNYGDISKIEWSEVPDFDLFTYSSPCQDFSQAGKQRGGQEGSGTRSSLLWECKKAIMKKKPKFCVMENVAAFVSHKFIETFNEWQLSLERLGYKNYAKVLNAKDYGVPQNRDRVFLVSIREDLFEKFYFPTPKKLDKRLIDVLENDVDEKYYVNVERLEGLILSSQKQKEKGNKFYFKPKDGNGIANALTLNCGGGRKTDNFIKIYKVGNISNEGSQCGTVVDQQGLFPTLSAGTHGYANQHVLVRSNTKQGYSEITEDKAVIDTSYPTSKNRRGRVQDGGGISPTLTCGVENSLKVIEQ